jgi:hypothetical protein
VSDLPKILHTRVAQFVAADRALLAAAEAGASASELEPLHEERDRYARAVAVLLAASTGAL